MSIENLLTLGVAAGILAVAVFLRLLFLGALKLFHLLTGTEVARAETVDEERAAGPGRPLARPALNAFRGVGRGVVVVLSTLGAWMFAAGSALGRAAVSGYASLSPRVAAGGKNWLSLTKGGVSVGAGRKRGLSPTRSGVSVGAGRKSGLFVTKSRVSLGAGKMKTFAIMAVATAQHVGSTIARMVNEWSAPLATRRREQQAPIEEAQEATVIRLDREWDPLTDPLEDQPLSNYR